MKPPNEKEKKRNQVRSNEKDDCACDNSENNSNQKIYESMKHISVNDECPSGNFGDRLQLTN